MNFARKDIQRACQKVLLSSVALAILNLGLSVGILVWGVPWFGPALMPAAAIIVLALATARSAFNEHRQAADTTLLVSPTAFVLGQAQHTYNKIKIELRPWAILIWDKPPDNFTELPWAQKTPYFTPIKALYLPQSDLGAIIQALKAAPILLDDRRQLFRWGVLWLYGITAALVLGAMAFFLFMYGGLGIFIALSDWIGELLGVHPVKVFLVTAIGAGTVAIVHKAWLRVSRNPGNSAE